MVITIEEPKQEGWNHSLSVKGLVAGDYVVLSVDNFKTNQDGSVWTHTNNHPQYGQSTSYLAYVDVFDYSYFDSDERKVIDKENKEPVRCSYFMSEAIYKKIIDSKVPNGKALKLGMKKLDNNRSTYVVEQYVFEGNQSKPSEEISDVTDDSLGKVEEVNFDEAELQSKVKEAVQSLRNAKIIPDNEILELLKKDYPEELIKKELGM